MNRNQMLRKLKKEQGKIWDVLVIGGGATGLGTALDSSTRGFKTLLLEQSDYAKG
ncbi:MAG: FAD-dependent oxidoreductase, partial [Flavobacteriaceae bacterium]|nr:FAD-dependent oxidoreductase [Flavobacteriaceae bacterium]